MRHPNEPTYEQLLHIREELQTEENVDVRKLKAISIQIARNEED